MRIEKYERNKIETNTKRMGKIYSG
jgi:hypothetical protein